MRERILTIPTDWRAIAAAVLVLGIAAWAGLLAEAVLFGILLIALLVGWFYRRPAALVGLLFIAAPLITYRGPLDINPFRALLALGLVVLVLILATRPEVLRLDAFLVLVVAFVLKETQSFAASDHIEFAEKQFGLLLVGLATIITVSTAIRFGDVAPKKIIGYLVAGILLVSALNLYEIVERSVFRQYWVTLPFATVTVTEHHQIVPGIYRTHLPLSTPNHYGSYAAVALLVLAGILRVRREAFAGGGRRLVGFLLMPALAVTFLCTFSRTAIVSLFTGIAYLFGGKRGGKGFLAAALALLLIVLTFALALTTASVVLGFEPGVFLTRLTTRGRFGRGLAEHYQWKVYAVRLWSEYPLLGAGMADYGPYAGQRVGTSRAHSIYFTILAESGLVGLLLFVLFLWALYRLLSRAISVERDPADRLLLIHLAAGFVGFLVASMFYDFFIEQEWWWVYLGLLHGFASRSVYPVRDLRGSPPPGGA